MRAYLALGSNLGDRLAHLKLAAQRLADHSDIDITACSRVYETEPVGPPQGRYYNAVIAIETSLPPEDLLKVCKHVEDQGERVRTIRWGPRTIDLDIIDAGGTVVRSEDLVLPHPELENRPFVLVPLADVAPNWRHPVHGTALDSLLDAVGDTALAVAVDATQWCTPSGRQEGES